MNTFHENHIRARKLARSPEHYAALVEVFCEIDRIAARLALSVPMDHGYVPPLSVVTRDYINARLLAAGVTPEEEGPVPSTYFGSKQHIRALHTCLQPARSLSKWGEPIPITPAEYIDALGNHYYYWRAVDGK